MKSKSVSALWATAALAWFVISAEAHEFVISDSGPNGAIRDAQERPAGPLTGSDLLSVSNLLAGQGSIHATDGLGAVPEVRPLDAEGDFIRLVPPRLVTGTVQVEITGPPGVYGVIASSDLVTWRNVGIATNLTGSATFVDLTALGYQHRQYRALRLNPPDNMVYVRPNIFTMGSPTNEFHRQPDEGPQTIVVLTHGFWIGKFEVTQAEYLSVTQTNPSFFTGDLTRPVESVSWPDATNYCAKLTEREIAAGRIPPGSRYRLPTEAEWECAARAGTTTRFSYGDDPDYTSLTDYAWELLNAGLTTHPVGQKRPNPWGLYDMTGNVWEWCQDWFGDLPGWVVSDPAGPPSDPMGRKVVRGGSYDFDVTDCRSAHRFYSSGVDTDVGFRVVLEIGVQ